MLQVVVGMMRLPSWLPYDMSETAKAIDTLDHLGEPRKGEDVIGPSRLQGFHNSFLYLS